MSPRRAIHPLREASKVSFLGSLLLIVFALITGLAAAATGLATGLVRKIRKQLVDQALEHNGRLGLLDPAAVLEVGVRAARTEADVLAAEQTLCLDAGEAVIRNLVVLVVNSQYDNRLEGLGVEEYLAHIADPHPGDRYVLTDLEIPDVVEFRRDVVPRLRARELQPRGGQLGGEEKQRREPQGDEHSRPDFQCSIGTHVSP